eukprot:6990617-Alexandrium_andersonii.AAC.1
MRQLKGLLPQGWAIHPARAHALVRAPTGGGQRPGGRQPKEGRSSHPCRCRTASRAGMRPLGGARSMDW